LRKSKGGGSGVVEEVSMIVEIRWPVELEDVASTGSTCDAFQRRKRGRRP
jgi:hypothetical protein